MTRWWDPGSDVALLDPIGHPTVDLANAITALHRAGAAAIGDAASTYPVLDETILIQALAEARAQFAPMLIEPIAKATGEAPAYAGLLLRDVFDDAETAALQLFRTAVAKGVPRRMAADRVARIYGVGASDLGRYTRIAVDPKTPPAVIVDLADETLFQAVAKLADAETSDTIAKADVDAYNATTVGHQHPKADDGTFTTVEDMLASLGPTDTPIGGQTAPLAAPPRVIRRATGPRRAKRPRRAVPRQVLDQQTSRATSRTTARQSDRAVSARAQKIRDLARETNSGNFELVSSPAGRPRDVPDHLELTDTPPMTTTIDDAVSVALPYNEATRFFRDAPTADKDKLFRADALLKYWGAPQRSQPEGDEKNSPHDQGVYEVAKIIESGPAFSGAREPYHRVLTDDEENQLATMSKDAQRIYLDELKADLIRDWADELDLDYSELSMNHELGYVDLYPIYQDIDRNALVYTPQPEHGHTRPIPTVAELHLPIDGLRGTRTPATRHGAEQFDLDRNQPLAYKVRRDSTGARMPDETYYDVDRHIMRTQMHVRLADEDEVDRAHGKRFGKADEHTVEEYNQTAVGQLHPKDTAGKFTNVEDMLAAVGPTDTPIGGYLASRGFAIADERRAATPRRAKRARSTALAPAHAAAERTTGRQTTRETERPTKRGLIRAVETTGVPEFLPFDDYTVLTDAEMHRRLGVHEQKLYAPSAGDEYTLDRHHLEWLTNRGTTQRKDTEAALLNRGMDDWDRVEEKTGARMLEPMRLSSDVDWTRLERRVAELVYEQDVQGLTLTFHRSMEDGDPVVRVAFAANKRHLPVQNAVRWESGTGTEKNLRLTYEGETSALSREVLASQAAMWRTYDTETAGGWFDHREWVVNPRVRMWRVERVDPDAS